MTIAICVLSVLVVYLAWNQRRLRKAIAEHQTGLGNLNQSLIDLFFDQESPINQAERRSLNTDRDIMRAMRVERQISDEQARILAQSGRLLAMLYGGPSLSQATIDTCLAARSAANSVLIDREGLTNRAAKNLHVYHAINLVLEQAQEQIATELSQQTEVRRMLVDAQREIEKFERQGRFSPNLIRAKETLASAVSMLENHDYASAKTVATNAKWLAIECSPN